MEWLRMERYFCRAHMNQIEIYPQFKLATDEFEKVVGGVQQIQGFDALVVTLEEHLDIYSKPEAFQEYYDIFKNMTSYVDGRYTNNTSRTFIGRGSEAGSFNSAVIQMVENDDFPKNKKKKRLHFSFST